MLPLAYEQIGLLYAVLGLSACHLGRLKGDSHLCESAAVDYRLKAITALGRTIKKVGSGTFDENECDGIFATIQILLLHDVSCCLPDRCEYMTKMTGLRFANRVSHRMGLIYQALCLYVRS